MILDSVETECRTALLALQRAIEGIISPYTDHLCIPYRPVHREMCGVLIVTGQYFQELSRLGLWPMATLERPDAGSFSQLKGVGYRPYPHKIAGVYFLASLSR